MDHELRELAALRIIFLVIFLFNCGSHFFRVIINNYVLLNIADGIEQFANECRESFEMASILFHFAL